MAGERGQKGRCCRRVKCEWVGRPLAFTLTGDPLKNSEQRDSTIYVKICTFL